MRTATTTRAGSRPGLNSRWPSSSARYDRATSPATRRRRGHLIGLIDGYRRELRQAVVSDYSWTSFDTTSSFSRIGNGSLGGKARALAFVRHLLSDFELIGKYAGVQISVPPSVVLTTEVFDRFLEQNHLRDFALGSTDDREIQRRFLEARVPRGRRPRSGLLPRVDPLPLAVRSSSLLEDSQYQPLAGVYETYMLPNNHGRQSMRLAQLQAAIKRVYASTFSQYAKNYFRATPYRTEEEKMAVIVQKLVGSTHGDRFYPDVAGVARSYNFYPAGPMVPEDGIAAVALGLGRVVVDGEVTQSFCPRYPQHLVHFSTVKDMLGEFPAGLLGSGASVAPSLARPAAGDARDPLRAGRGRNGRDSGGSRLHVLARERRRVRRPLASRCSSGEHGPHPQAQAVPSGGDPGGTLEIGAWGMNTPVEIEFAVNLSAPEGTPKEFGFLQMRPLARSREVEDLDLGQYDRSQVVCESPRVLGNGTLDGLHDAIVVDYRRFDRSRSHDAARRGGPVQRQIGGRRPVLRTGGSGTLGLWRSLVGDPRDLGADLGGQGDRGIGSEGHARTAITGEPLLPEPHLVPGGLLHREPGGRRGLRRLGLAGEAVGGGGGHVCPPPPLRRPRWWSR